MGAHLHAIIFTQQISQKVIEVWIHYTCPSKKQSLKILIGMRFSKLTQQEQSTFKEERFWMEPERTGLSSDSDQTPL